MGDLRMVVVVVFFCRVIIVYRISAMFPFGRGLLIRVRARLRVRKSLTMDRRIGS